MAASRLTVTQRDRTYDVRVERGLLAALPQVLDALLPGRPRVLVTDDRVAPLLAGWLGATPVEPVLTVPAGETFKSRESWGRLTDQLLGLGLGRDGALVAIGGGVIGDLAGFVAATYLRGIPVVQVPTTLLAMVDASVGGKVGVDTPHGKNLVGAFHPPAAVLIDPVALGTLPARELAAGFAETVKHGLIADAGYFGWIRTHVGALLARDLDTLAALVTRSVELKAAVVARDPLEDGERAILNAGHTIGHAVEQVLGYELRHGECVAIGLVAECRVAESLAGLDPHITREVAALLAALGLPVRIPAAATTPALLAAMRVDKKNRAGTIRLALPRTLGAMDGGPEGWTRAVDEAHLVEAIAASR